MSGVAPPQIASKSRPNTPAKTTTYTVRAGDTLTRIATSFKTTVAKLMAWNNLSSTSLTVGRKLLVAERQTGTASASPSASKIVHKVRPGETLHGIASSYNTSVDAILSWNNHDDLSVLHPGDRITIFTGENR
jgi:LysM repeat protein